MPSQDSRSYDWGCLPTKSIHHNKSLPLPWQMCRQCLTIISSQVQYAMGSNDPNESLGLQVCQHCRSISHVLPLDSKTKHQLARGQRFNQLGRAVRIVRANYLATPIARQLRGVGKHQTQIVKCFAGSAYRTAIASGGTSASNSQRRR